MAALPLDGVLVADFSRILAGPLAAQEGMPPMPKPGPEHDVRSRRRKRIDRARLGIEPYWPGRNEAAE